jgi:hypothetical protein
MPRGDYPSQRLACFPGPHQIIGRSTHRIPTTPSVQLFEQSHGSYVDLLIVEPIQLSIQLRDLILITKLGRQVLAQPLASFRGGSAPHFRKPFLGRLCNVSAATFPVRLLVTLTRRPYDQLTRPNQQKKCDKWPIAIHDCCLILPWFTGGRFTDRGLPQISPAARVADLPSHGLPPVDIARERRHNVPSTRPPSLP